MRHSTLQRLIAACKSRNKKRFNFLVNRVIEDEFSSPRDPEGVDPNPRGPEGNTLAHLCYKYGFIDGVRNLIYRGIDTHEVNDTNALPIHLACENDQSEIISWHLETNSVESEYQVVDSSSGFNTYMWLASKGNLEMLKKFVARGYVDPNAETNYRRNTVFTLAIQHGQPDIAWFLWENGLQGSFGLAHCRRFASIAGDIIAGKRHTARMFKLMEKLGRLDLMCGDIEEEGVSTLMFAIQQKRHDAFVCMVKLGFARPCIEYDLFRDFQPFRSEVQAFIDRLLEEIQLSKDFKEAFLVHTIKPRHAKMSVKVLKKHHHPLEMFPSDINRLIAEFLDIPFGKSLFFLREAVEFIETLLTSVNTEEGYQDWHW